MVLAETFTLNAAFVVARGFAVVLALGAQSHAQTPSPRPATPVHAPATEGEPDETLAALQSYLDTSREARPTLDEQPFAHRPLTRPESEEAARMLWKDHVRAIRDEAQADWNAGRVVLGEDTMRFLVRRFGSAPFGERSLWISLHGGGGAPPEVNDQQWQNQVRLYQPAEGIYVAPRGLQDTWDLWHEPRIDRFLDRLIECAVAIEGVDPDRVFLMGYSAGGDGVYRLAPRLADRFAAASMMAGHPGDADPRSLRNLPFAIQMGGDDTAYERHLRAAEWGEKLASLRDGDPGGYPHLVKIHEGVGHWMQLKDAFVLEWMARHMRTPWPRRVVWHQHGITHPRMNWIAVDDDDRRSGSLIVAEVVRAQPARRRGSGAESPAPAAPRQRLEIVEADVDSITLWLHDALIDLDEPVVVTFGDKTLVDRRLDRTIATLAESLEGRRDPRLMAPVKVELDLAGAQ